MKLQGGPDSTKNQKSSRKSSVRKRSRSKKASRRQLFEKQIDALPEFKGGLLATSGMNKNYSKSTKAIVDAQVDPTLFDSNCYYKPKVNKKSEAMANQGR